MDFNPVLIWFLAGLALIIFEFTLPGVILVFFGIGAWITALTTWMGLTNGWTSQLLVFAVSSVLMLVFLRRWFRARFFGHSSEVQDPLENLDEFRNQVVIVTEDIDPESGGKVEFKGADWSARCDTALSVGSRAVIQSVDGITLLVRPEK
ncbi:MAG: NfeD family protein [Candidatus Krumholzibacteria bacterium]|nr:NfeD family protein [Candidatus Krumholzibacteria bacterium]